MKIEDYKKLLEDMDETELLGIIQETRRNRTESVSEARIKKTRKAAKEKNLDAMLEEMDADQQKKFLELLKNENLV